MAKRVLPKAARQPVSNEERLVPPVVPLKETRQTSPVVQSRPSAGVRRRAQRDKWLSVGVLILMAMAALLRLFGPLLRALR